MKLFTVIFTLELLRWNMELLTSILIAYALQAISVGTFALLYHIIQYQTYIEMVAEFC